LIWDAISVSTLYAEPPLIAAWIVSDAATS
jgi:hypothetical protein